LDARLLVLEFALEDAELLVAEVPLDEVVEFAYGPLLEVALDVELLIVTFPSARSTTKFHSFSAACDLIKPFFSQHL
jgi:hypothetical protein